jgi:presenilin-like A22 family membrane protease
MFEQPILFPSLPAISVTEILIVLTIASIAYFLVFNNFEKHVPIQRRIIKLFIVVGVLAIFGILFGRFAFWGVISLMTIGQVYLHGVYFPKHGINGLTAEPYDKYLETIERMKGKKGN